MPEMTSRPIIGCKEVVYFPEADLTLCCKVDTGARTSSLHAEDQQIFMQEEKTWIRFTTQNLTPEGYVKKVCEFPVVDQRLVKSSNGVAEERYVIRLQLRLGPMNLAVELTLTDRSSMKYPMLLGRRAMAHRVLVAPGAQYLFGTP